MRLIRDLGFALIAAALIGFVVALTGHAGLWLALGSTFGVGIALVAASLIVGQRREIRVQRREIRVLRVRNAELTNQVGAVPVSAEPVRVFVGGTHFYGEGPSIRP